MTITELSYENPFRSEAERFENVDMSEIPPFRGFWTDQEVFTAVDTSSQVILKALQKKGLIQVSKYKNGSGKWVRAWTHLDFYIATLVHELGTHASLSVRGVCELLSLIPREVIDSACSPKKMAEQIIDLYAFHVDPEGGTTLFDNGEKLSVIRDESAYLIISNRQLVFLEFWDTKNGHWDIIHTGQLHEIDSSNPKSERFSTPVIDKDYRNNSTSVLRISLSRLGVETYLRHFKELPLAPRWVQPSVRSKKA